MTTSQIDVIENVLWSAVRAIIRHHHLYVIILDNAGAQDYQDTLQSVMDTFKCPSNEIPGRNILIKIFYEH